MRIARARKWFWETHAIARLADSNPLAWLTEGAVDAEEMLLALDTGDPHPWLEQWKKLNANFAPGPDEHARHFRQMVCLFCVAIERLGRNKRKAREEVGDRLRGLPQAPTANVIKNWQQREERLDPAQAEVIIAKAFARGPDEVTTFFVSVIAWYLDPRWCGGSSDWGG
jgi:hypothetical protein